MYCWFGHMTAVCMNNKHPSVNSDPLEFLTEPLFACFSSGVWVDPFKRIAFRGEGEEKKESPSGNKAQSRRRQIQIHIGLC